LYTIQNILFKLSVHISPAGGQGNDPHGKIIEALIRIEDKLTQIAAKVGA